MLCTPTRYRISSFCWPFGMAAAGIIAMTMNAAMVVAAEKQHVVLLGDGKYELRADPAWKKIEPRVAIIQHEFAVTAAKGDKRPGRITVTSATGSVQANIDRWFGQFAQPDGTNTKDRAKVEKKKIAGQTVHLVDISGTYNDKRGPFSPGVKRPDHRMLAAIIVSEKSGKYFVKFYGPEKTVKENNQKFSDMIKSLKANL